MPKTEFCKTLGVLQELKHGVILLGQGKFKVNKERK
jgi:hypothetical protein